jgi:uroporphyrinogen decarboxylase
MNKIIKACNFEKQKTPPIWLMRQAGRYLPEYRKIRSDQKNFLSMCYNSKIASEITLQPIKRFDFDAAIIFSDILVIPHNLGVNIVFEDNIGPIVERIDDLDRVKTFKDHGYLENIYEAISLTRANLDKEKSLIGFAGSPWTVLTYLLDEKNKKDFVESRKKIHREDNLVQILIEILTDETIKYLKNKIRAGVDLVQVFDSWCGILSEDDFEELVIKPTAKIVREIKKDFPNIPIIGFPKGAGYLYENYINKTGIDVVGVDYTVPISIMKKFQDKITVQGNLDPVIMLCDKNILEVKLQNIMDNLSENPFIFNLGHGILPTTPIENVEFLVDYIRNYEKR